MATTTLFDVAVRTDPSPASHGEDSFTFLNRGEGIVWDRIRDVLNEWFQEFPTAHAADLRGRFRRKQAGAHWGAWWELYLHRLFTQLGYQVTVHPEIVGTSHRPDFEITRGADQFYVEAVVVFSGIQDSERDGTREGWILAAINRGSSRNFFVRVEFEARGLTRPKVASIYRPIEEWLDTLDPDQVLEKLEERGMRERLRLETGDWCVLLEAIPKRREARGEAGHRLVGMGPISAGAIDDKDQLRHTLKRKRGRYGSPDVPIVVAVNCMGLLAEQEDIAAALFGSIGVQYDSADLSRSWPVRMADGTWIGKNGPRGRRMSAVLSAVQLHPWTSAKTDLDLWMNPFASVPLHVDWPFTVWTYSETRDIEGSNPGIAISEILGLPPAWPGPEKPFGR